MPEKPAEDRTEPATPKRREEAREKGNVARSVELNSAVVLLMGVTVLFFISGDMMAKILGFMRGTYHRIYGLSITPDTLPTQMRVVIGSIMDILLPIVLLIMVAGLAANVVQVGFVLAKKALIPSLNKISPMSGFKRIFSLRSGVEALKGFGKIILVSWIGYSVIHNHYDEYVLMAFSTIAEAFVFLGQVLFELSIKIGIAMAFLAVADYAYQKYDHEKNLRMTKQEVKDESKQYEGSPEVKGRQKSLMRSAARRRMMDDVPSATVVVTNPTHIAVALRYQSMHEQVAPKVVAKGKRKIAEKIKSIAREYEVPVIENKPLARSLFETTDVGMEIPGELYQLVAEVLAQVYQMKQGRVSFA